MKLRNIVKAVGSLLTVLGALMLSVPLIDIIYHEPLSKYFLLVGLLMLTIGLTSSRAKAEPLTTLEALIAAAIAWVIIPIISAFALMLEINIPYLDALFESVSGFTGTGFTVLTPSTLKHSILFWRSLMQWSGELGFVVFAMVLVPYFYTVARNLYGIERPVKIETTFYRTAIRLIIIYLVLTILGIFFYIITGMPFFDAVNHVLTTVATGGMSTYDQGYDYIYSFAPNTYLPVVIFMILGGINFLDLHKLFTGRIRELIKSEELKYYIGSLIVVSTLASLSYAYVDKFGDILTSFKVGFFNTISGMTTTGFNIGSLSSLSDTTKVLITLGMFIGAMTFSTAGGIKSFRLMLLMKKLKNYVQMMVSPTSIVREISIQGKKVSDADISASLLFIILHAAVIVFSAIAISSTGYTFTDALFESTSAAGCVGLSVGVVSSSASPLVKSVIIVDMIMGRIEYLHLLLIMAVLFSKRTILLTRQ